MTNVIYFHGQTSALKVFDPHENKDGQKHKTDRIVIELNE